jgi:hypothetical protein
MYMYIYIAEYTMKMVNIEIVFPALLILKISMISLVPPAFFPIMIQQYT